MNNFVYYNPTKIYFGNEQLANLADEETMYFWYMAAAPSKRTAYMTAL